MAYWAWFCVEVLQLSGCVEQGFYSCFLDVNVVVLVGVQKGCYKVKSGGAYIVNDGLNNRRSSEWILYSQGVYKK